MLERTCSQYLEPLFAMPHMTKMQKRALTLVPVIIYICKATSLRIITLNFDDNNSLTMCYLLMQNCYRLSKSLTACYLIM